MKKLLFILSLVMFFLTSCESVTNLLRTTDHSINTANRVRDFANSYSHMSKEEQRLYDAGRSISARTDPNSGAYVAKSEYNTHTFEVALGNLRLKNSNFTIRVLKYDGYSWREIAVINKTIPTPMNKPYRYDASTDGRAQKVSISSNGRITEVRIHEGQRLVGSHIF